MYYPCSENKDADQLRGYREADQRLCFRIAKIRFSHNEAQIKIARLNMGNGYFKGFCAHGVSFLNMSNYEYFIASMSQESIPLTNY